MMKQYWLRVAKGGEAVLEEQGNKKTQFVSKDWLEAASLAFRFLADAGEEVCSFKLLIPSLQKDRRLYEIQTRPDGNVRLLTPKEAEGEEAQ